MRKVLSWQKEGRRTETVHAKCWRMERVDARKEQSGLSMMCEEFGNSALAVARSYDLGGFIIFNLLMNHLQILLKMQIWIQKVWGGTRDSAFLTRSQVMWMLMVHGPNFELQGTKRQGYPHLYSYSELQQEDISPPVSPGSNPVPSTQHWLNKYICLNKSLKEHTSFGKRC